MCSCDGSVCNWLQLVYDQWPNILRFHRLPDGLRLQQQYEDLHSYVLCLTFDVLPYFSSFTIEDTHSLKRLGYLNFSIVGIALKTF